MDLLLRPLATSDVDEVVALSLRAWAPVFASFEQVLGRDVYRRLFPDWLASQADAVREVCLGGEYQVWVADAGGRPVGFVAVTVTVDQESSSGEIYMIAVDPSRQRNGVGGALTAHAVAHIRNSGCTLAVVATGGDDGHAPARRTYERAGFTAMPQVRYYMAL